MINLPSLSMMADNSIKITLSCNWHFNSSDLPLEYELYKSKESSMTNGLEMAFNIR
jgi:hypothetical protein